MSSEFTVFSFNVWGLLELIAKNKTKRIAALAQFLKDSNYDCVCLQELWSVKDYKYIKENCKSTLKYSQYFHSGIFGSGLAIFSKWPIRKTFFNKWDLNGYPHMLHHGDWLGGKGVALAQLSFHNFTVNVYNSHFIAKYNDSDDYLIHRISQAFHTGLFVDFTSNSADFSIFCGDLNVTPDDICYELITILGHLNDTFDVRNAESLDSCGTYGVFTNSYTNLLGNSWDDNDCRIDYILYKSECKKFEAISYRLPIQGTVPGEDFSYSDHEAVEGRFLMYQKSICSVTNDDHTKNLLEKTQNLCLRRDKILFRQRKQYLFAAVLLLILWAVLEYMLPSFSKLINLLIIPFFSYCIFLLTVWYTLEQKCIKHLKIQLKKLIKDKWMDK